MYKEERPREWRNNKRFATTNVFLTFLHNKRIPELQDLQVLGVVTLTCTLEALYARTHTLTPADPVGANAGPRLRLLYAGAASTLQ